MKKQNRQEIHGRLLLTVTFIIRRKTRRPVEDRLAGFFLLQMIAKVFRGRKKKQRNIDGGTNYGDVERDLCGVRAAQSREGAETIIVSY